MANFVQNDISPLIFFYFWQPVYYLLDAEEQSFPGKSKEKRARWAGIDENIGTKMCWKLVDDDNGEIICSSTIRSTIEPGSANLQVDPINSLPDPPVLPDTSDILDDFMSLVNFEAPITESGPVGSIPDSTKSRLW